MVTNYFFLFKISYNSNCYRKIIHKINYNCNRTLNLECSFFQITLMDNINKKGKKSTPSHRKFLWAVVVLFLLLVVLDLTHTLFAKLEPVVNGSLI